jgi:hypothetical protein
VVQFEDREVALTRKRINGYLEAYELVREQLRIEEEDWRAAFVRAEEDRIILSCQRNADTSWMHEKAFPVLLPTKDPLY